MQLAQERVGNMRVPGESASTNSYWQGTTLVQAQRSDEANIIFVQMRNLIEITSTLTAI